MWRRPGAARPGRPGLRGFLWSRQPLRCWKQARGSARTRKVLVHGADGPKRLWFPCRVCRARSSGGGWSRPAQDFSKQKLILSHRSLFKGGSCLTRVRSAWFGGLGGTGLPRVAGRFCRRPAAEPARWAGGRADGVGTLKPGVGAGARLGDATGREGLRGRRQALCDRCVHGADGGGRGGGDGATPC